MHTGIEDQLKALKTSVKLMKPVVAGYFDQGIEEVRKAKANRGLSNRSAVVKDPVAEARKGGTSAKDTAVNSGPGSWILEQFTNIGRSLIDFEIPPMDSELDVMKSFSQQLDTVSALSSNVGKDIRKIFPTGLPTLKELTFAKLEQVVMSIGLNIAEGALELGKGICLTLLDVAVTLIDAFHAVMFTRIRLPLMEKLWELVSGKKKDLSFSIIDLALLPAALLSTITFKLAFPKLDITKVLEVRLPAGNVVAVQSSGLMAAAYFIKDVMSTFINFIALMFDSVSAGAELLQSKTGWFGWLCWTLGFIAHVIPSGFITGAKKALAAVLVMEWLAWMVGFAQHAFKYYKNALPVLQAAAFLVEAKFVAVFEVISGLLRCTLRAVAIVLDKDGNYPVLEMVQFYGNSGGKMLNAAARLIDETETKVILVAGTMIAALFVGLVPGIVHNITKSTPIT